MLLELACGFYGAEEAAYLKRYLFAFLPHSHASYINQTPEVQKYMPISDVLLVIQPAHQDLCECRLCMPEFVGNDLSASYPKPSRSQKIPGRLLIQHPKFVYSLLHKEYIAFEYCNQNVVRLLGSLVSPARQRSVSFRAARLPYPRATA